MVYPYHVIQSVITQSPYDLVLVRLEGVEGGGIAGQTGYVLTSPADGAVEGAVRSGGVIGVVREIEVGTLG